MKILSIVNVITPQIQKLKKCNRSEAMKLAYRIAKSHPDGQLVKIKKLDGGVSSRFVVRNWWEIQPPKGGTSNTKPGQVLMADLAKFAAQSANCIISTYNLLS